MESSRIRLLVVALGLVAACRGDAPAQSVAPRPVLRVGVSGDYPPFSARIEPEQAPASGAQDGGSGGYVGFDTDLAERVAGDLGYRIAWVPFRWPELSEALVAGRFDVAMSGVTVRPERSVRGRFALPVAETGAVVLVRPAVLARRAAAEPAATPADALDHASVQIAVNAGGHLERVARDRFPAARIMAIADNRAVREALVSGRVDAVVTDTLEAPGWRRELGDVRVVGPLTRDRKAWWLPPGDEGLARRLDAWLLAAEADGRLAALRDRWFGAPGPRTAEPLSALLAACDERLSLMPFVADHKRRTGLAIVDPAREERVIEAGVGAVREAAQRDGRPPPAAAAVRAFYRAQIDAAVEIQRDVLAAGEGGSARPAFDLESELRPALLRIGDRMAWLLPRLPQGSPADAAALALRVRSALGGHGLATARLDAIADAIAGLRE